MHVYVGKFDWYEYAKNECITLTMMNPHGQQSPAKLSLQYSDATRIPSTSVFTGKLDWFEHSRNEMVTLIIPGDVANGKPVVLSRQWTRTSAGIDKENAIVNGTMESIRTTSDGNLTAKFDTGFYKYDFTILGSGDKVVLGMTSLSVSIDPRAPYHLDQTDFRDLHKKKALIVRYGTGTDNGIFKTRDMLVNHLGFSGRDVELSYFDIDPTDGPNECTLGQDPPTIANFKSKFTYLCTSAVAGDVRFLYVDAHGMTYPDEDGSGEQDGNDEGWILAENTDGTSKAVLKDDWLADAIRKNLKKGVNLTIVTSSCMGGGMLDTHKATPGILLAGCHETQFNVKALKGMDPWIVAITTVIKNNYKKMRGVPTYTTLYNDAKNFIRAQLAAGQLNPRYQGPSPKEYNPLPRHQEDNTSHQDPQLIFYKDYFDPGEERFLVPFQAPSGGEAGGKVTRYPEDEYPRHDEL
ncbi:hypothetical protein F4813DRAFT_401180 [Daldinia decipiens]|uniref:uncharacterized protein n=1 Tax=Daldinia decipiens TaxID=326647 RepID=UPI0020C312D1|nr:uncharacterized protein F4813DRAFT_401180 [Daldinia decipiens]KAI1660215.1 hypothetical protein F4813DRAFT_401180 [Daldinia decipiens]